MFDEYFKIVEIIAEFDKNLLLIKGWSVTFGLATIALAFKEKSRGMFLTAALSALCFWILEGEVKWHQTNYYYRMNQIELECQKTENECATWCPKIDWSWREAARLSTPFFESKGDTVKKIEVNNRIVRYFYLHVLLPHFIVLILGIFFFRKKAFDRWVIKQTANTAKETDAKNNADD